MAAKLNPLLAAVLKEVPGADSSRAQRLSWLRMVAMALDTVYGAPEGPTELPDFLGVRLPENPLLVEKAAALSSVPAAKPAVRLVEPPRFFIDHAGAARRAPSMEPITPEMLGGDTIFDDRGEFGDLGSILWADGRRGVLGLQLSISATPVARSA